MSVPDAEGTAEAARPQSRFARFITSRLALVIAAVLTLALVALTAVTAIRFFSPPKPPVAIGTPMASAFTLETQVGGSPFLTRGQKGTILVSVKSDVALTSLELWDDDHPYIVIDDPSLITLDDFGMLRMSLDFVPLTAGGHILFARATDADGGVAQSAPTGMSVLDLPTELGIEAADPEWLEPPDTTIESAPGDTLAIVSARLAIPIPQLIVFAKFDPKALLPVGTLISAPVPFEPPEPLEVPWPPVKWDPGIKVSAKDCAIMVESTLDKPIRLYGGPGNVLLGEVLPNGAVILPNMPIGKSVITGLPAGSTKPLIPMSAILPDDCAKDGWTGDAYVTGGVLLTDKPFTKPYLYIAVDKGEWQRVPAADGATLSDGQINDIRSYVDLTTYDQIDLEVWTADGLTATRAATGQFCRKDASAYGAGSSADGGECSPPKQKPGPGVGGPTVAAEFTLTITPESGSYAKVLEAQPGSMSGPPVIGPGKIRLDTNACKLGYQNVRYQFSFFEISPGSPGLLPPGVFHYLDTFACSSYSSVVFNPKDWQFSSIEDAKGGDDALALDDQIALEIAEAHLIDGAPVVGDMYVRAIALDFGTSGQPDVALGAATKSSWIMNPANIKDSPITIADPKVQLVSGLDENASWTSQYDATSNWNPAIQTHGAGSVGGTCVEVVEYPKPNVWTFWPQFGPHTEYDFNAGKEKFVEGNPYYSDLELAKRRFENQKAVYCVDEAADGKRWTEAYEAAKENAKCTISCVLTFVVYGALQGFLIGGPAGALVGAIGGLYLGVLSYASPGFYADLKKAWDAVAAIYNVVFDKVAAVLDKIDPICRSIDYLSDKAGSFCTKTVHVAAKAAITYYTGLPPSLSTSAELEAAADGQLEAALMLVFDAALKQLGLDCSTFDLSDAEGVQIAVASENKLFGGKGVELNGCKALAGVVTKQLRKALDTRQVQVMAALTGLPGIEGLVIQPFSDRGAAVVITAPEPSYTNWGAGCQVITNTTVTENGKSYTFKPEFSAVVLHQGIPTAAGLTPSKPFWYGQIPVGVVPQTWWQPMPTGTAPITSPDFWQARKHSYVNQSRILHSEPAKPNAPYLHVEINSPCFEAAYTFDAPKYATFFEMVGGTVPAFRVDNRQAVGFH